MARKETSSLFERVTQVVLPTFTIIGFLLISMKKADVGLLFNLVAQVFWVYSGYIAWKRAGQIGFFISAVITTILIIYGVINYWFL